jgi:outer membrane lipoprotein-sorting protein
MNDPREQQGDALAQLAEAFAGQTVPHGPDEAMKQRLIVALERQSNRSTADQPLRLWRGWTMRKTIGVAAMLLVMVAVGGFFGSRPGSSGAAFAAMIDRIKDIRSVRFLMRNEFKGPNPPPNMESTITFMAPWTRYEATVVGQKVIGITNSDQHKTLMLFEGLKTATLNDEKADSAGSGKSKFVDALRSLPKEGAKYVGKEQMDGVEAMKYRYQHKGDFYTVWIDPTSKLPIHILGTDTADASAAKITSNFSNFKWDVPIEAAFFTLEPPAGYTVSANADK